MPSSPGKGIEGQLVYNAADGTEVVIIWIHIKFLNSTA